MDGKLDKIVAIYHEACDDVIKSKNASHIEFELRARIDNQSVTSLINGLKDSPIVISQSINLINKSSKVDSPNRIMIVNFIDGIKDKKTWSMKKQLFNIDGRGLFHRYTVSKETPVEEFPITTPDLIRFKWRISIILEEWNVDITYSRETQNVNMILNIASEMFKKEKAEAEAHPAVFDDIELELEFTGEGLTVAKIREIEDKITNLSSDRGANHSEYQRGIGVIASLLLEKSGAFKDRLGLKQFVNPVIDLTKNKLHDIELCHYYITDKADGERAIAYTNGIEVTILTSTIETKSLKIKKGKGEDDDHEIKNSDKNFVKDNVVDHVPITVVVDAEYIKDTLYVFDVLYIDEQNLMEWPFSNRVEFLERAAEAVGGEAKKMMRLSNHSDIKKQQSDAQKVITTFKTYTKKLPYICDGYILTPDEVYYNKNTYKVKFPEFLSIDFLVMRAPASIKGIKPYDPPKGENTYFLFSGISEGDFAKFNMKKIIYYDEIFKDLQFNDTYFPIQFAPSSDPFAYVFHSKEELEFGVYEMQWVMSKGNKDGTWRILRRRDDRNIELARGNYFGNPFWIAESIWESYKNPIVIDDLYSASEGYFKQHDVTMYKEVRSFNNYVKSTLMKQLRGTVIDLGAGKGQDINKYNSITEGLFIDIDALALQELVSRKKTMKSNMNVSILQFDLTKDYNEIVAAINAMGYNKVNNVVCNLAINYLVSSSSAVINLVNLVNSVLLPGGKFMYSAFDGKSVLNLLESSDKKTWDCYVDTVLKYHIKKLYTGTKIGFGQKIEVLLPFSAGEYYTEFLVNVDEVNKVFARNNFTDIHIVPFKSFIMPDHNLDDDDRQFVSLYTSVTMIKSNKPTVKAPKNPTEFKFPNKMKKDVKNGVEHVLDDK